MHERGVVERVLEEALERLDVLPERPSPLTPAPRGFVSRVVKFPAATATALAGSPH
jgi:hypothetical protein